MSEDSDAMDAAAEVAALELKGLDPDAVAVVTAWWRKHFLKAGHKRLARALLQTAKPPRDQS
jgi:hypothetical protein